MVRIIPASRSTLGAYPSFSRASVMSLSLTRIVGGMRRNTISERLPVRRAAFRQVRAL